MQRTPQKQNGTNRSTKGFEPKTKKFFKKFSKKAKVFEFSADIICRDIFKTKTISHFRMYYTIFQEKSQ